MTLSSRVLGSLRRLASRSELPKAEPSDRLSPSVAGSSDSAICNRPIATELASLAMAQLAQGRPDQALDLLERAVANDPRSPDLLNDLGGVLQGLGRVDEALERFTQALELREDSAPTWMNLGSARMVARQWEAAAAAFRRALVIDDRAAPAWNALGVALSELGQDRDAEDACREALVLQPDWLDGIANLAGVLAAQGRFREAKTELQTRLRQMDTWTAGWKRLAAVEAASGDLASAERSYRKALALDPTSPSSAFDLAHVVLGLGRYEEGFELFENRFAAIPAWFSDELRAAGLGAARRTWNVGTVAERHVLVLGEQGFGDQLMMFRYLPRLRDAGAVRVSVMCAPELVRIAERVPGVTEVVSSKAVYRPGSVDLSIPALSLPFLFRSAANDLPDAAYLQLDPNLPGVRPELAGLPGLRVGLAWAGNSTADDRARRNFTLESMRPLLDVEGVSYISVQKGRSGALDFNGAWNGRIIDPMGECHDFLDTATVIASLDLVICVDTAVAHLAGAMGVPVWLLLKTAGEWRWGATSLTSPWYPKMRIFRQVLGADWSGVIEALRVALAQETEARSS